MNDVSESRPVGTGEYTVRQGEGIESIAFRNGLFWQTVWLDPGNDELREHRSHPNALLPGDKVHIPEKRVEHVSVSTETKIRFRQKGVPSKLHLVLLDAEEQPRANLEYRLSIDGRLVEGNSNAAGEIIETIAPDAQVCMLTVGQSDTDAEEEYEVDLGYMDPLETLSGVQGRLNNLGFECSEPDGQLSPQTTAAVRAFQKTHGLSETGELDAALRDKLLKVHGS
jgi:N-acetylmuramoyl-L-alanine amidase